MKTRSVRAALSVAGAVCALTGSAGAATMHFIAVSNNGPGDAAAAEAQLSASFTAGPAGKALLTLSNTGSHAMSVANLYIDDGAGVLSGISSILATPGVQFRAGGSPANLPDSNEVGFDATTELSAESKPGRGAGGNGRPANGVQAGERLEILYSLAGGATFEDLVDAVFANDLRLGVHVIGFDSGESESLVTVADEPEPNIIPMPTAGSLAGLAMFAGAARRRRR